MGQATWLREIVSTTAGGGTGFPFLMACLSYWFKHILGFTTDYVEYGIDVDYGVLGTPGIYHGTNGELNLTGTDKDFTDPVWEAYWSAVPPPGTKHISEMVGRWIVVKDPVTRNCGIYKIVSAPGVGGVVTIDFRSGGTEYPTGSTGIEWWSISDKLTSNSLSIACLRGDSWASGTYVIRNDGTHINNTTRWISRANNDPGYTPATLYGWIVSGNRFNRANTLVGKTLNWMEYGVPFSWTFTGTSPLTIVDAANQLNGVGGAMVAQITDTNGYQVTGGENLSFGDGGNLTLIYSGSSAWSDLGLTGTSNLTAPTYTTTIFAVETRNDPVGPPIYVPTPAATIASSIDTWFGNYATVDGLGGISFTAPYAGSRGDGFCSYAGAGLIYVSGGYGGTLPTRDGNFFRCKTPHASGWAIRVELWGQYSGNPVLVVTVSTNGTWGGGDIVVGPVYLGVYTATSNWLYAVADPAGEWVYLLTHEATNNRHNGCFVSPVISYETGLQNYEKIALHGCTTNAVANWAVNTCLRNYDDSKWGHGLMPLKVQAFSTYMMDATYSGQANSFVNWASRESNARTTKPDFLIGSTVIMDVDNLTDRYRIIGRLKGHYLVRSSLTVRTAFDDEGTKDKLFWYGGTAFDWPGVTPQH